MSQAATIPATDPADGTPGLAMRRGMVTVFSGQALAYAITFASLPALAAIYGPSDFAAFGIFAGLVAIVGSACCLCYERIVPIVRTDRLAVNGVALCLVASMAVAFLTGAAVQAIVLTAGDVLNLAWLHDYIAMLMVSILAVGVQQAMQSLSVRRQDYRALSAARVSLAVVRVTVQVVLGFAWAGPAGLLWGFTVASILSAAVAGWMCRHEVHLVRQINKRVMRKLALRYKDFPSYATIPEIVQRLTVHLPAMLLAATYSLEVAGWYSLALRLFAVPQTMLQQAVSRVYFGVGASTTAKSPHQIAPLFRFTLKRLLVLIAPLYMLFMLTAPFAFQLCFAAEWHRAGIYCSILAPMFFLRLVGGALRPTIDLLLLPKLHTFSSMLISAGLVVGIGLPYIFAWPAWAAIVALSICVGVGQVLALLQIWNALPVVQPEPAESLPVAA